MHAALTCLTLEHHQALRLNGHSVCPLLIRPFASFASQTLDSGAAALGATLVTNQLRTLSVAFTGAADGACETIALAIALRRPLEDLCLCGNGVGPSGVQALSTALEAAGCEGCLTALNLSANQRLDAAGVRVIARALPCTRLVELQLAGVSATECH